jgi:anthranilate phosphoribosyltransferase
MGPTTISELVAGRVQSWSLDPMTLQLPRASLRDLQVSSVDESASALRSIFAGERSPRRDIVLLNAAAALVVAERVADLPALLSLAAHTVDSGAAQSTVQRLVRASQTG